MLKRLLCAIEPVVTTLWVGAHWSIGYIAVPILFSAQADRQLAGRLAGEMFHWVNLIALVVGGLLVVMALFNGRVHARHWRTIVIVVMLGGGVLGEFLLQPEMTALKSEGMLPGSSAAMRFGLLHGISSLLYLLNALLGVVLIASLNLRSSAR